MNYLYGYNYYKLKEIDKDGYYFYSNIILVKYNSVNSDSDVYYDILGRRISTPIEGNFYFKKNKNGFSKCIY